MRRGFRRCQVQENSGVFMPLERPDLDLISHSPRQTRNIGLHLGQVLQPGDVILLFGQIGSGKTLLTQGIAAGLNVEGYVQSPTFTLATEHVGTLSTGDEIILYHLDLYRIDDPGDIDTFGHEEYLDDPHGIVVIEWPERLGAGIPDEHLLINIEYLADTKRKLTFYPRGERYRDRIVRFRKEVFGDRR
jgi:tRNA threonylcarbamoyladenosine biosynthesis protein TsaE